MSFSEDVRHELVERPPAKSCCRLAFLSGLIRHAGSLQVRSGGELAAVAELADPAAARLAFTLLRERGADCEILSFREQRFQRRNRVLLRLPAARSLQLLHEAGVLSEALAPLERPPRRLLNRCLLPRRLPARGVRGRRLGVGAAAPGAPGVAHRRAGGGRGAGRVAAAEEIPMRTRSSGAATPSPTPRARRRSATCSCTWSAPTTRCCRCEEAEVISAHPRGAANRLTNCDRANLGRTSAAAHRQSEAIAQLDLDALDPRLRARGRADGWPIHPSCRWPNWASARARR